MVEPEEPAVAKAAEAEAAAAGTPPISALMGGGATSRYSVQLTTSWPAGASFELIYGSAGRPLVRRVRFRFPVRRY